MNIIMGGTEKELNTFIQDFRDEFMSLSPEEIAYPRSCNGVKSFAELTNCLHLALPYMSRVLFCITIWWRRMTYLTSIRIFKRVTRCGLCISSYFNIYQSSAFSFITFMPKELDIYKYIDYDAQFEKSFVEPLKFITDKIKWLIDSSYGTQGTLEDFFA